MVRKCVLYYHCVTHISVYPLPVVLKLLDVGNGDNISGNQLLRSEFW
jgi:hypothetical protein